MVGPAGATVGLSSNCTTPGAARVGIAARRREYTKWNLDYASITLVPDFTTLPTSIPYTQAYGEINYRHRSGIAGSIGADYTGTNNWTNGPAFVVW